MLPFLQPKKMSATIIAARKPSGSLEPKGEEGENAPLMAAAEDLISAVHSKNASGVMDAMKAAFEIMDSMPDEGEGE